MSALVVAGTATAINVAYAVGQKKDPFPRALAGITLAVLCVAIDSGTNTKLGTYFALLFLLASFLYSGVWLVDTVDNVIQSAG